MSGEGEGSGGGSGIHSDGASGPGAATIAMGFVGMAMFAATLPATRLALQGFDPVFVTAGRAVLAAVLAAGALILTRTAPPRRADLWRLAVIGLCLIGAFPFFSAMAMTDVGASHGGVVLAMMPIATAVAATFLGGERPGRLFWVLGVAGAAIVAVFALSDSGWSVRPGDVFLVLAAASAGIGYALSGTMARSMAGWAVIAWALVFAFPITLAVSLTALPDAIPTSGEVIGSFIYLGVFSMFLGFLFWNTAMARGGIARIGQIQLLQPFVTTAVAALFAGEAIEPRHLIFAAAVVAVVAAAQKAKVRRLDD